MPFRDWSADDYNEFHDRAFETIFNEIPTIPDLDDDRIERAEVLFEAGWLTFGQYSKAELDAIRDEFYDTVFIPASMFDWEEYRDLYSETG